MNPKNQIQHNHQKIQIRIGIPRFFAAVVTAVTLLCLTPMNETFAQTFRHERRNGCYITLP
jgi:hypothetical protein